MAFNISSLPPGASIVTADGNQVVLDGTQQIILASNDDGGSSKDASVEVQLRNFWSTQTEKIRQMRAEDFRHPLLPLARIKKIMKLDEDVGMISSEAPVVLSKACEVFIEELTLRAWLHVEENKRRTLQRNDVATAVSKCDQFDFLIDIVPRDETKPKTANRNTPRSVSEVQYYVQNSGGSGVSVQDPQSQSVGQIQMSTVPIMTAQVQQNTSMGSTSSAGEPATVPVMINTAAGDMQQANLQLSAQQIDAIRQYIATLGIPINGNQIVIQAPTAGGNQLNVSINPEQLQAAASQAESARSE